MFIRKILNKTVLNEHYRETKDTITTYNSVGKTCEQASSRKKV